MAQAENPMRIGKLKLALPPNIRVDAIGPAQTLSQMLLEGELDALYTARPPSSFRRGEGNVTS